MNKTTWVRENLPEEFHGCFGEVLALLLNKNDLAKLKAAIDAYGERKVKETV